MRILVLSSVYRDESLGRVDTSTNVVNLFVREWNKQGHEVLVIHNSHCYPKIVHKIPKKVKKMLASKMGFEISDYEAVKEKEFMDYGVKIFRLPIKKFIPHCKPSNNIIEKQVNRIIEILEKENFKPEVITGHWASPQMEIISKLKMKYNCRTAIVLHGGGYIGSSGYKIKDYLKNIDLLGARSLSQSRRLKDILKLEQLPFVCSSGIPDEYIDSYKLNTEKYNDIKTWRITYVGRLVSYKNIDSTIRALSEINDINWEFNIVGEGAQYCELEKLARSLNCIERIHFFGHIQRNEVMQILKDTHIFVMISKDEVFGLVYLEAMAASSLVVASRNGGVDGIIVDNENGFLCTEGNTKELKGILINIMDKDKESLKHIVAKGYERVKDYSDYKVAERYLCKILEK
jgi:conserved hypothetical protein